MLNTKQQSDYELGASVMPYGFSGKALFIQRLMPRVYSNSLQSILNGCLSSLSRQMPLTSKQVAIVGLCIRITGFRG